MNYRWLLVGLLCLSGALNYADRTALSSVFPLLKRDLGATDQQLGAIGTAFLWAYAIASPIAGAMADRLSRSRLIVASLVAWSLVTLLSGAAQSVEQLIATRALLGLAEAAYIPSAIALIADYHGSATRAKAIGLHTAGITAGLIAGGTGAGYLGEHYGWRAGLFVLGLAGLALAAVAHFLLRDAPLEPGRAPAAPVSYAESLRALAARPSTLIIIAVSMLVSIGTWIFLNWLPLYFTETYGLTLAQAGFAGTAILQGSAVAGLLTGGWLSDHFAGAQPRRRMLIQAVCLLLAAPFLLAFLAHPALGVLNICIVAFSFFNRLGGANESPLLCDLLPARLRSTAIGLFNAFATFAGGAGVLVAGYLKQTAGLAGVFGGISLIMLAAATLAAVGYTYFLSRDLQRAGAR